MGITSNCTKFLFYSKSLGANFEKTLMLGRQQLYANEKEISHYSNQFKIPINNAIYLAKKDHYAEPLFGMLGAKEVDSMDISGYENATIIHDLNNPISDHLKNKYDLIFDGGTLEHVFNFPTAIRNCMDALKKGGHFVSITPTNNYCGHGFYQFSPELFFSIFDKKNGFETKIILLALQTSETDIRDWYEVANPKDVKKRVTLCNDKPTFLMVLSKKTDASPTKELIIQQSDYENVWNVFDSIQNNIEQKHEKRIWIMYRKYTPKFLRKAAHKIINIFRRSEKKISGLGSVNPSFFKKVNI